MSSLPKGILEFDHFRSEINNDCVITGKAVFKDEDGVLWLGHFSSFTFDLKEDTGEEDVQ